MGRLVSPNEIREMINEEIEVAHAYNITRKILIAEGRRLQLEGASTREINEGVFDMLGGLIGSVPGGVWDTIKNNVTKWLLSKFGIEPDRLLAKAIANVVEEIDLLNIPSYFSEEGCEDFAELLVQALGETLADEGIDYIMEALGLKDEGGYLYQTIRESLTNYLGQTDWAMGFKGKVAEMVCNFDINSVLGGLGLGGAAGADKATAKKPAADAPEADDED